MRHLGSQSSQVPFFFFGLILEQVEILVPLSFFVLKLYGSKFYQVRMDLLLALSPTWKGKTVSASVIHSIKG